MKPTHISAPPHVQWMRMGVFGLLLLAFVLLPFVLWSDAFDHATPRWLQAQTSAGWLAMAGIALLVADVVLPIPSSIVSAALCWQLGPFWGGISVAVGCLLAFVFGYGIGRTVPESRLRSWIGPSLWDSAQRHARQRAMWWIVVARPLPLLAEVSALLAGLWRIPLLPAIANATAASCVMGALYGLSAWLGRDQPAVGIMLLALLALPSLTWALHRMVLRRWLSVPASTAVANDKAPRPMTSAGSDSADL
jgi:membrane protein YqaA with SNARE-associated domain